MTNDEFIKKLDSNDKLKSQFHSDIFTRLGETNEYLRKLTFYILSIPILYIALKFTEKDSISFIGADFTADLFITLTPIFYFYLISRTYSVFLWVKDQKSMMLDLYQKELKILDTVQLNQLLPFSMTDFYTYKIPKSGWVRLFGLVSYPYMLLLGLSPIIFGIYSLYVLSMSDVGGNLKVIIFITSAVIILHLLFTFVKQITYNLENSGRSDK